MHNFKFNFPLRGPAWELKSRLDPVTFILNITITKEGFLVTFKIKIKIFAIIARMLFGN